VISIAEALAVMEPCFAPLPAERVPLDRALGRFLAADLIAREDVPGFDNSAMDGYAVRASDLRGASDATPVALALSGESRAGGPWPTALREGTLRIFTGAPLPEGADAVVMQEDVRRDEERILFSTPAEPGKHVRRRAEVLTAGSTFLSAGARIGPGEIGLAASQGYAALPAHRAPRAAILATGDELREIGEPARPGTLVDSSSHAIAAAVREAGGEPIVLARAADDRAAIAGALRRGLACADVVLTCGGVSVGEYDLLHDAIGELGGEQLFWKVRVKPGKPIRFDRVGGTTIVALPGNPVSSLVTFELFVRPQLRRMLGDPRPHRAAIEVEVARALPSPGSRTELVRARLEHRERALPLAHAHRDQGSGALTSLAGLDVLIVRPAGAPELATGSVARALDVRAGLGEARSIF
jgi:molybdopterin molybdotransferase